MIYICLFICNSFWLQGEENAPPLVRACLRSIRGNCRRQLILLDENTLSDYIELPGFVWDKYKGGDMRPAHFADIARVELLHNYGGFYERSAYRAGRDAPVMVALCGQAV
ncbi:MAG: capsular polysaccharide synthesis protein [Rickettsiales bacterium]|nr:capsular polysaccharide synthesis protein [Rickettsiales bacterium]